MDNSIDSASFCFLPFGLCFPSTFSFFLAFPIFVQLIGKVLCLFVLSSVTKIISKMRLHRLLLITFYHFISPLLWLIGCRGLGLTMCYMRLNALKKYYQEKAKSV
jgi:hypothetical protein